MVTTKGLLNIGPIGEVFEIVDIPDNEYKTIPMTVENIRAILNGESPLIKRTKMTAEDERMLLDTLYILEGRQKEMPSQKRPRKDDRDRI